MVIYRLNKDLSDSAEYYWITSPLDKDSSFKLKDFLRENQLVYPVDDAVYRECSWPELKKKDLRRLKDLRLITIDPPGSQIPERTAWVPSNSVDIARVHPE